MTQLDAQATQDIALGAAVLGTGGGDDPDTVEVLDLEEVPLAYLPGNAVRIKVKAVGSLRTI